MPADEPSNNVLLLDRYRVYDEIAAGGMATVHLGTLVGDVGFSRLVAVKRLHPHFSKDRSIVTMFTDEARIAARIRHPNVVTTLDVISRDGEVFLVMEYVHGEPFSRLLLSTSKRKEKVPPRIVGAVMSSALHGLHAAHEAKDVRGRPLGIVHRDISPQNIIVGTDGIARVLDFGIARAAGRLYQTNDGAVKGKLAYMSPEQLMSEPIDRRSDIYAAGVVLWEALTCKRLHAGGGDALVRSRITQPKVDPPSMYVKDLPPYFDEVAMRAMCPAAGDRFPTALAMAEALEVAGMIANPSEVAAWVESLASETLAERATIIERIENAERRNSMTSVTDEIDTHRAPQKAEPSPHFVEATVKMSTSALIAVPIKPPVPPAKSDAFAGPDTTTVTLRRDVANTRAPLPPPVPPPLAPPVPPSLAPPLAPPVPLPLSPPLAPPVAPPLSPPVPPPLAPPVLPLAPPVPPPPPVSLAPPVPPPLAPPVLPLAPPAPPIVPAAPIAPSANILPSVPPTPVDVLIAPAPPPRRPAPTIVSTSRRSPVSSSFWWMWIAICVGVFLLSAGVVALVFSGDEPSNAAPRPSSMPSAKR